MKQKILLFTLVHPDFLPPVYACAQTLRDQGYNIHILTFDSYVPSETNLGKDITLESVGKHHDIPFFQRWALRRKYASRANDLVDINTPAIIAFCPFSFLTALKFKASTSVIYFAMEIADFTARFFSKSPLSQMNNLLALNAIQKADLVATPSVQRSAWLAGRSHLETLPQTILNSAYYSEAEAGKPTYDLFKKIVPEHFLNKKLVLYTGAVNERLCVAELVQAFELMNDNTAAMAVTGFKDNKYCNEIKRFVANSRQKENILLLPYVSRDEMLALQANADIGACLVREYDDNIASKMIAPNKVGEYLAKGLFILGVKGLYMNIFETAGVAALSDTPSVPDICASLKQALTTAGSEQNKKTIKNFVTSFYCMQKQAAPIIEFLAKRTSKLNIKN